MRYTTLPNTDIKVSKICLGTMTFGEQNSESEAHEQMNYALDNGVNFFDTAEIYAVPVRPETTGLTEKYIGTWFKSSRNRDKVVLASKIVGPSEHTSHIRKNGYQPHAIKEALEGSLKRLQTDYIDLYQLHWPVRKSNFFGVRGYQHNDSDKWEDDFNEILHTLQGFIKEGKIRHVGVSNETCWGVNRFLEEAKYNNLPRISTIQNVYSLLIRLYEEGLAEIGIREGVGLLAYSPMAFGRLSGKYINNTPKDGRLSLFQNLSRYNSPSCIEATKHYINIANKYEISPAQMSLAFVTDRPFVTSNIIGATKINQLKENIDSVNVKLSSEILDEIQKVHSEIHNPAC